MPHGFPYDLLPPSSSSSDEGIREENTKDSNVNEVSSSTLNDKGMSLHSFPVESEIFPEKSPLSIQTFQGDVVLFPRGKMDVSNFTMQIPPNPKRVNLNVSTFRYKYVPLKPTLSAVSAKIVDIPGEEKNTKSKETNTDPKQNNLTIKNIPPISTSKETNLSISTFQSKISPLDLHEESSEHLKKLARQMMTLQGVFKKVKVTRDLNFIKAKPGLVEIKQFIENSSTQTPNSVAQNTDFSPTKVESLILECEFYRAASNMIKRYPFYYDFLKRSYEEGNVDGCEKLRYLRPKQRSFKRAVIHAQGCNQGHLEAVNTILFEFFRDRDCLCCD